ncbi:MAG: flavin reductase [Lachnospiraceae bacterium]|nr:flavin reductase [Lachnospiraceae bacterium]
MGNEALFKISYGLFVLSAEEDGRDNACIVNTFLQITSSDPITCVISVNKQNFTHDMIAKTKKFNLSVLSTQASFEMFKRFGFQSGRTADKLSGYENNTARSSNGVIYITESTNAYLSFDVTDMADFNSHTVFTAVLTESDVLNNNESLTYSYYHQNIKPKPQAKPQDEKNNPGWRCKICGHVYEGETLPSDYICPLCKHGAEDFEAIV